MAVLQSLILKSSKRGAFKEGDKLNLCDTQLVISTGKILYNGCYPTTKNNLYLHSEKNFCNILGLKPRLQNSICSMIPFLQKIKWAYVLKIV